MEGAQSKAENIINLELVKQALVDSSEFKKLGFNLEEKNGSLSIMKSHAVITQIFPEHRNYITVRTIDDDNLELLIKLFEEKNFPIGKKLEKPHSGGSFVIITSNKN